MKHSLRSLSLGTAAAALMAATLAHAAPVVEQSAFVSAASPSQTVNFQVFLPLRNTAALDQLLADQQNKASSSYHKWLTPADFNARFGPTAVSMANVQKALVAQGLTVAAVHPRSFEVTGPAASVSRTFATRLQTVQPRTGPMRMAAATPLALPAVLQQEGAVVNGLSGLAPHHTHARQVPLASPDNRNSNVGGYYFTDLKQAYGFPSYQATAHGKPLDGTGASVAIVISNDVLDSDIQADFDHEKFTAVTGKPAPKINRLLINGGGAFDPNGGSVEGSLDTQMVLGAAPGANVTLVNIPDLSNDNTLAAYQAIVESNKYDIVSSSFGECELFFTAAYNGGTDFTGILQTQESVFKQGNAQGITFIASSGDSGGLGCTDPSYFSGSPTAKPKFIPGVESPADSPSVTAVGGTNLITTTPPSPQTTPPQLNSAYVSEQAFGDPEIPYDPYGVGVNVTGGYWGAGGGQSVIFKKPGYQNLTLNGANTRTLPDVGMHVGGCPGGISVLPCGPNRSYVIIYFEGQRIGLIGTSVAAPEFAGATALFVEQLGGRVGNLNNYLYAAGAVQSLTGGLVSGYHRYIPGFDGKYDNRFPNGAIYDYLVGQGTPKVKDLFLMSGVPSAGVPQTPSNP